MSKVSIITTTYKHQDFIAQTIESILAQTYSDWEMLIGDDSPDNKTRDIIQQYVKKYPYKIKAWHHNPNKGLVDNMNFLISHSSPDSEYIAFLEGDDMFTPNNLQKKIDIFNKYIYIICVYSEYQKIDNKGNNIPYSFFGKCLQKIKENIGNRHGESVFSRQKLLMIGNPIQSFGSIMIKKHILYSFYPFKNLDPNNKNFGILDYYVWLNILPGEKVYKIKDKIFLYRYHNNNLSSNIEIMLSQANYIYEEFKVKYINDKENYSLCDSKILFNKGIISLLQGQNGKAIRNILKSFKHNKSTNIIKRLLVIFLSIFPRRLNNLLFKLYRKQ